MNRSTWLARSLAAALLVWLTSPTSLAQNGPARPGESKAWVVETLRRYRLADKAASQDVERLAELRTKILTPGGTFPEVLAAFQEVYSVLARLQGNDAVAPATVMQGCGFPAFLTVTRLRDANGAAPPASHSRLGDLAHVEKMGNGPIPMVLIPDYGTDWTLYRTFMERNRERYTMYAITLPGFGGSLAPPRPNVYDPAETPWWNAAEKGVLELIARNRLDRPVVVGTQTGAYLAARIALDHPEKVRGAVLLNGFANVPIRSAEDSDAPMSLGERRRRVGGRPDLNGILGEFIPQVVLTPSAAEATLDQMSPKSRPLAVGRNTRDPERGKALYIDFMVKTDPRALDYAFELSGTDLTFDLRRLRVPMLSIPSVPDLGAPPGGDLALGQWQEIKRLYPAIPLTLTPFENTRNYATEEAPLELDQAIAAFVAGRPVEVKRT